MRIGYFGACTCLSSCFESVSQSLASTILSLDKIRRDPEAFQKTLLIALSIIRGLNYHCNTHYLPNLIKVLDQAPSFDVYGFCRLPHELTHPYRPECLDEYAILDRLEVILCNNWQLGRPDDKGDNRDYAVRMFAKVQLAAFLNKMVDDSQDFRNEADVKIVMQHWFERTLQANPEAGFNPQCIDLHMLPIAIKEPSFLDSLKMVIFIFVDIACVPAFLQGWSLIDLAPYANTIGKFSLFSWISYQSLDDWIWQGMCAGHLTHFLATGYSLWQGGMTPGETRNAKWLMAMSIAESGYCLSIILKHDPKLINILAFIAKSLGVLTFLLISRSTFFYNDKD
jgi:hypothetical protein